MPRARNIKPGFFKNEALAECDIQARLLFIGLWTLADREGRLEERPKRIKAEIYPYDDDIDIVNMLDQLQKRGFIYRYKAGGMNIIQIKNFLKHQNPHYKERESELPPMPENTGIEYEPGTSPRQALGKSGTSPRQALGKPETSPAESLLLNPDILNPSSLNPKNDEREKSIEYYEKKFNPIRSESEMNDITDMITTYGGIWFMRAIDRGIESGARTRHYISSILSRWRDLGKENPWEYDSLPRKGRPREPVSTAAQRSRDAALQVMAEMGDDDE